MKQALSLLLLFTSLACFSQINFKPGYFITNNGTKTECLIRNVAWKDCPVEFDYKASESAETQKGLIKDVSEFNVDSYKFKRFTVSLDRSSTILDQMSTSTVPEWKTETLFLKVLVEGKATLYQYEDGNTVKYFFSTGDHTTAEQLLYREHKEGGVVKLNTKFRQQLYNLMKDKMPDTKKFENIRYRKDILTDLFVDYNGGNGEMKDLTVTQNRSSVNFKITPGIGLGSVTVTNRLGTGRFDFDAKPVFRIGGEIEYIMPFNNNKWALFTDPNVQFYKNDGSQGIHTWKMEYKFIELPFGARHYMFLNNNSKLFLDAAFALSLNMGDPYIEIDNIIKHDITQSSNFAAGLGFAHKQYSAEVRYTFSKGLTKFYDTWGAKYTSVGLILGYKLF